MYLKTMLGLFSFVLINISPSTFARAADNPLFSAAAKGDNRQVRRLLRAGADVDAVDDYSKAVFYPNGTALMYAAEYGYLSTVKLLLASRAHIRACDVHSELFGGTYNKALNGAAMGGHADVVRFLLRKGVNINSQDDNGYTPLLMAADRKSSRTVRLLLRACAHPNLQTRHGNFSALMLASQAGARDSIYILLRSGADVTLEDRWGQTALWYARHNHHWRIVALLKHATVRR